MSISPSGTRPLTQTPAALLAAVLLGAAGFGCSETSPTAPGSPAISAAKGGTGGGGISTSVLSYS